MAVCLAHSELCWRACQLALWGHTSFCAVTQDGREDNLFWWHCSQILLLRQIICKERKQGGMFRGQKWHQALRISRAFHCLGKYPKEDGGQERQSCHSCGKWSGRLNGRNGRAHLWCNTTSLSITLPFGDREVTQKTGALQRFMECCFISAEACLPWNREDWKQKASTPHPVAAAGVVHPTGTKAFLLFSLSSGQGRRAGWETTITAAAELQPEDTRHCTGVGREVQHPPQPAPWSPDRKPNNCPSISRVLGWQKHWVIAAASLWSTVNYSPYPNSSSTGKERACSRQFDPGIDRMLTEGNS